MYLNSIQINGQSFIPWTVLMSKMANSKGHEGLGGFLSTLIYNRWMTNTKRGNIGLQVAIGPVSFCCITR